MFYQDDSKGKPSGMKCPITGSDLIYDGYDYGTMDGDSYYHSESDPSLKWEKNMRSFYLELIHEEENWMSWRERTEARRYFRQDDEGKWIEYFAKISVSQTRMFPIETSMIDVYNILQLDITEKELREKEYERKVASGEIDPHAFPVAIKIAARTIGTDIIGVEPTSIPAAEAKSDARTWTKDQIEIKPLPAPIGHLFYLDYVIQLVKEEPDYPYNVTKENFEAVKKNWEKADLQIGDQITQWDKGGWGSLAGRAGEHIRRNGKIVASRLTKMS